MTRHWRRRRSLSCSSSQDLHSLSSAAAVTVSVTAYNRIISMEKLYLVLERVLEWVLYSLLHPTYTLCTYRFLLNRIQVDESSSVIKGRQPRQPATSRIHDSKSLKYLFEQRIHVHLPGPSSVLRIFYCTDLLTLMSALQVT